MLQPPIIGTRPNRAAWHAILFAMVYCLIADRPAGAQPIPVELTFTTGLMTNANFSFRLEGTAADNPDFQDQRSGFNSSYTLSKTVSLQTNVGYRFKFVLNSGGVDAVGADSELNGPASLKLRARPAGNCLTYGQSSLATNGYYFSWYPHGFSQSTGLPPWVVVDYLVQVVKTPVPIRFGETCGSEAGHPPLTADGKSSVRAYLDPANVLPKPITWSFDGPDLGCMILQLDTNSVECVVVSSNRPGTIRLLATGANGCRSEPGLLELVDPGVCRQSACSRFGAYTLNSGSSMLRLALGASGDGFDAGGLDWGYNGDTLNILLTPPSLRYNYVRTDVTVIDDGEGGVRQVSSAQGLIDVLTSTGDDALELRLYHPGQFVWDSSTNRYLPTGSAFESWAFQDSGGAVGIEHRDSGGGLLAGYSVALIANGLELNASSGLSRQRRLQDSLATTNLIYETGGGGDQIIRQHVQQFGTVAGRTRLVSETHGLFNQLSPASDLTTTFTYYTNGLLETRLSNLGDWEHHWYDASGRLTNTLSAFLNQASTTDRTLCRSVERYYGTALISGSGDNGTNAIGAPRLIVERLLGSEVSRTFRLYFWGEERTIRCATVGAAWNAADNLVTITKYLTNSVDFGRVSSIENPDGTMEFFQYWRSTNSYLTNVVLAGAPNAGKTDIVEGTRTVTITGPVGRLMSRKVYDIASGNTLIDSEDYSDHDAFDRPRRTTYLDGTFVWNEQGCCGSETVTNRNGVVVTSSLDALNRRATETAHSITISNVFDGAGRPRVTTRIGSNGSSHTVGIQSYDAAGRLLGSSDALGRTNSIAYNDEARTATTTSADGATRVESYFKDGSVDSVVGTGVHPVRYTAGILSFGGVNRSYTAEIKLDANGGDTPETVTNVVDLLGRPLVTIYPAAGSTAIAYRYYNSRGQLTNQVDPDGIQTLYSYNGQGEVEVSATDMNQNGAMDLSGPDRVRRQTNSVVVNGPGFTVHRSATYVWDQNTSTPTLLGFTDSAVDGLRQWQVTDSVTNWSVRSFSGSLHWTTSYAPDGAYTTSEQVAGRPTTATRYSATASQLGRITNSFDNFGRRNLIWDARTGATTNGFDVADQVVAVATPAPVSGGSVLVTTTEYDSRGRPWRMVLPDNTSVTNEYFLTGELKKTSGSRTYPVAYIYDAQGRMTNLTTWQDAASGSGSAVTTWNYDSRRGWLSNKRYADGFGPNYTNSPAGRLIGRRWARSIGGNPLSTTYTNNGAGEVVGVTYNDSVTANVGHVFDRLGRLIQINQGTNVTYRTYNLAGQLLSETQNGLVISNRFDAFLRRTNLSLLNGASTLTRTQYGFDNAGRLAYVADGTNVAAYSYLANSPLIQNVRFTNSGTLRFTTQKDYDLANRLTNIASWNSSFTNSFAYTYNTANQRTRVVLADGSYWVYEYDRLGQVTGGRKYWRDGSSVAGQQFGYTYDDIGNRKTAASGGDDLGLALRTSTYTANNLNQYSSRTVPGYLDILGAATNTATVLVNNRPTSRKDEYFRAELPVDNSQGAVWQGITNVAYLAQTTNVVATNQGNLFLPRTPETFLHDADGNLTNDGRWVYSWDAENRLTQVESLSTSPTASKRRVTYTYDWHGRRVRRQEYDGTSGSYVLTNDLRMAYDGWQCLGDLTTNLVLQRTYVWGLDLSGSRTGAGGVGGLLWYRSASNGTHYASYDGNGNVTALTDAVTGIRSGTYEYGPFGQTLRLEGVAGADNGWRFSTKRIDPATELVLYEYRVYNWQIGQWLTRDPIEELGSLNLQMFCLNTPVSIVDSDGRRPGRIPLWGKLGGGLGGAFLGWGLWRLDHWHNKQQNPDGVDIGYDEKHRIIRVKKCQIIIFLAHNRSSEKETYTFKFEQPGCSAAAYVGCWPAVNNETIEKMGGRLLSGAPLTGETMFAPTLEDRMNYQPREKFPNEEDHDRQFGTTKDALQRVNDLAEVAENPELDAQLVVNKLIIEALKFGKELYKDSPRSFKCQCNRVEIIVYNHDADPASVSPTFKYTIGPGAY